MDFHRTRKTKKQTKHTHRGKTSGRATAWGATAARLLRVAVLAVDVPAVRVDDLAALHAGVQHAPVHLGGGRAERNAARGAGVPPPPSARGRWRAPAP